MKLTQQLALVCLVLVFGGPVWAASDKHEHERQEEQDHEHQEEHDHDRAHEEHGDEHGDEPATRISAEVAKDHGIVTDQVGPATLRRTVKTYGRVVVPSSRISHIRARFGGLITDVAVDVGDTVKAGDLLATVEANASLKQYQIRAPIDGLVTQRHANAGEFADEQALLTLVDASELWVELRVFEGQLTDIGTGQIVTISSATQRTDSVIQTILPSMDEHPFVIARTHINNSTGVWGPGMFVEGDVVAEETELPLAIRTSGLQTMEDELGVFVKDGDQYEFKPLSIGRSDGRISEVLNGAASGTQYVAGNSFLIKADIEKSTAEHDH